MKISPFNVEVINEVGYNRLHITSRQFKGRIRKHLGKWPDDKLQSITYHLKYDLEKHFEGKPFLKGEVEEFVDLYISMRIKDKGNIFDFFEDFIEHKRDTTNKRTKKKLSLPTITAYRTAKMHFEKYSKKKNISLHPSKIDKNVLDNFYHFIDSSHNHKVKMHNRFKSFIKYLDKELNIPVNKTYVHSKFNEEYDHMDPDEDDIALSVEDVKALIKLKQRFDQGKFGIQPYKRNEKLPEYLQEHQFNQKKDSLKKCLDCFLLMIGTGQYYADIRKSKLFFTHVNGKKFCKYRRAKNGSLCKSIPIGSDDVFIAKSIIEEYNIRHGSNFPITLSLTNFMKYIEQIGELAELGMKLKNKMARKTFASILYANRKMPLDVLQALLGHQNIQDTFHYLRIDDRDRSAQAIKFMYPETA